MDVWVWMTGATLVATSAICGTILLREKMRSKALADYDFRKEHEYKQIAAERDAWYEAYESEHARCISDEALLRVQKLILNHAKFGGKHDTNGTH